MHVSSLTKISRVTDVNIYISKNKKEYKIQYTTYRYDISLTTDISKFKNSKKKSFSKGKINEIIKT